MAAPRAYKTDESFLEKLAMGGTGVAKLAENLRAQGHEPIELERGSKGWKVWKSIKIKRIRVPDLLCLRCGRRFECRAKRAFELSMSHSRSDAARGWDAGLRDDDWVAIVVCRKSGEGPTDWEASDTVHFAEVRDLKAAKSRGKVKETTPKGAQEGFEVRLIWPTRVASAGGKVSALTRDSLQFKRAVDGRTIPLRLKGDGYRLSPLVAVGDEVVEGQVLAAVVSLRRAVPCDRPAAHASFGAWSKSRNVSEQYSGIKALGHVGQPSAKKILRETMNDDSSHIYVRMEAASGLARRGHREGFEFIADRLSAEPYENMLEAVLTLSEIPGKDSAALLRAALLDAAKPAEVRAGAAWAVGELRDTESLEALVGAFSTATLEIQAEAARSLRKLADTSASMTLINHWAGTDAAARAGIAWALAKSGGPSMESLLAVAKDDELRRWVAYIAANQDKTAYASALAKLEQEDPEVFFATSVLWQIMESWTHNLEAI